LKTTIESLVDADPPRGRQWRLGRGFITRSPELSAQAEKLYALSKKNPHVGAAYAAKILRRWAEENAPELAEGVTFGTVKKFWNDHK